MTSELSSYEATLLEYLQALSDNSDHYSSVYLMDEKVLDFERAIEGIHGCDRKADRRGFKGEPF